MRAFRRINVGDLGTAILALSMVLLVDALWPRLQVLLSGAYLVPAAALKPLVALVSIAAVLLLRKRLPGGTLMVASLGFGILMILTFTNLVFLQGVSIQDALVSQNAYYWTFLLMPLVLGVRASVTTNRFTRVLLYVGLPLAAFGLLQFILQRPIVSLEVPEAGFEVNSWRFHGTGHLRAFSLFGSGQTFGYLLAPLVALLCVKAVRTRGIRQLWIIGGAAMVTAVAAATLTRNTYLIVGLTILATFGYLTSVRRLVWLLPTAGLTVAALIVVVLTSGSLSATSDGIFDATSLWIRLGEWSNLLEQYRNSSVAAQLFGLGLVQNDQASSYLRVLIDNSFLAVLLNSGLLGLFGWLALMGALWTRLHASAVRTLDEGQIAIAATFSTWAIVGLFNVSIAVFGVYGIWTFLLIPRKHEDAVALPPFLIDPRTSSRIGTTVTDERAAGATSSTA